MHCFQNVKAVFKAPSFRGYTFRAQDNSEFVNVVPVAGAQSAMKGAYVSTGVAFVYCKKFLTQLKGSK